MRNLISSARPASNPEQDLWIAVIFQAPKDAARLRKLEARYLRYRYQGKRLPYYLMSELDAARKALAWLTTPSHDLSVVCQMAGFEVDCILAKRDEFMAGKFKLIEPLIATHE